MDDVLITQELYRRPPKKADYLAEKQALQKLAVHMTESAEAVLPSLVDLALEITGSISGGISLFEEEENSPGIFRWYYLRGELACFTGASTPRDYSPCGICLDQHRAILVRRPEVYYEWLVTAGVGLPECLLVPLYVNKTEPLGTLWVVSDGEGYFDSNHARALSELASFVGLALHMLGSERELRRLAERQATIAEEMNHRLRNMFAMVHSMIHATGSTASSTEEFEEKLSQRMHALAAAHALAETSQDASASSIDLRQLLVTLLAPHDAAGESGQGRIRINAPAVRLGSQAAQTISLLIHEFATNAVKYGALSKKEGMIEVTVRSSGEKVHLTWDETRGPVIASPPTESGFGRRLARSTVRHLGGAIEYDWQPDGLLLRLSLSLKRLAE